MSTPSLLGHGLDICMYDFVVVVVFYPTIQEPYSVSMELGGKFEGKKGQAEGQERQNKDKRGQGEGQERQNKEKPGGKKGQDEGQERQNK